MWSSTWWFTTPSPGVISLSLAEKLSLQIITPLQKIITPLAWSITYRKMRVPFYHQNFRKKVITPGEGVANNQVESDITKKMSNRHKLCDNFNFSKKKNGGRICGQVHLGRSGQVHFDPSSEPALRQCHETSLIFSGDRADFGQCTVWNARTKFFPTKSEGGISSKFPFRGPFFQSRICTVPHFTSP